MDEDQQRFCKRILPRGEGRFEKPGLLFVGTEFGLFISIDAGKNWAQMNYNNNIPNVAIRDLVIHPRDNAVILATHGRSIMIIDELGLNILRQMNANVTQSKFTLFKTRPYSIPLSGLDFGAFTDDEFVGANPNTDPVVAYYLKDRQLVGEFKIEVLDQDGKLVNSAPAGKHKGVNIVSVRSHANCRRALRHPRLREEPLRRHRYPKEPIL